MVLKEDALQQVRDSIRDGTFPDSNETLIADLTFDSIPPLLAVIEEGRQSLGDEIRNVSKGQAGDVDEWVIQAKRVQDDIARCKIEARQIVREHERVEAMRNAVRETGNRLHLLQAEIDFTQALEREITNVGEVAQILDQAGRASFGKNPIIAVQRLSSVRTTIDGIAGGQTQFLLRQLAKDLHQKSHSQLQDMLAQLWIVNRNESETLLTIKSSTGIMNGHAEHQINTSVDEVLEALMQLDALSDAVALLLRTLDAFILTLLSRKSPRQPVSIKTGEDELVVGLEIKTPDTETVIDIVKAMTEFLNKQIPDLIRDDTVKQLAPKLISLLISNWLDPALPYELQNLKGLEGLRTKVSDLAMQLSKQSWPGSHELYEWVDSIPRTWLTKRRMRSLDAVRSTFKATKGIKRQVERVERQIVSTQELLPEGDDVEDWNSKWDDEAAPEESPSHQEADDGADAWGFDNEQDDDHANKTTNENTKDAEDDDSGEAWGWGDESPVQTKEKTPRTNAKGVNGTVENQELTLKESYTVTDIPDQILHVIESDFQDAKTLDSMPTSYFTSASPVAGLQAVPNLVLAMYRATAPTYYSSSARFSNMNLYNDTLYLIEQVSNLTSTDTQLHTKIGASLDSTAKFARQIYTRELEVQRTILSDLLDGAQGFVSCTRFPYNQECENAVTATTDRIQTVHSQWKETLGRNHLLQSIGSLITMVMGKMIHDVEDMEDISEPESKQLVHFFQKISSLDSLFTVSEPSTVSEAAINLDKPDEDRQPLTTIALYVPNYLRFQYLAQILESDLVFIKYLWVEGELSLEYSADEVVDLVKALFTESSHRRGVINEVRGGY